MSRNKAVLLVAALVILYLVLPSNGTGGLIKSYMLAITPYLMIFLVGYLLITINILKRALYRLNDHISTDHTLAVARMLRITFDVKRMMGSENLISLYKRVNFSKAVSLEAKTSLYNAMKRKKLDVPPPSEGKNQSAANIEKRSPQEVKKVKPGSKKKKKKKKK